LYATKIHIIVLISILKPTLHRIKRPKIAIFKTEFYP